MKLNELLFEKLEPSIVSFDKLKDVDGFRYDTSKTFEKQNFPNKEIEKKTYHMILNHMSNFIYDIKTYLVTNKDVDKYSITTTSSKIMSKQTNKPSFSRYINFKTKDGNKGTIRISDHFNLNNNESTYNMRYTTFFDHNIQERIRKFIEKLDGKKPSVSYTSGTTRKPPVIYKKIF